MNKPQLELIPSDKIDPVLAALGRAGVEPAAARQIEKIIAAPGPAPDDFDWHTDDPDIVVKPRPGLAIYENKTGNIVVRTQNTDYPGEGPLRLYRQIRTAGGHSKAEGVYAMSATFQLEMFSTDKTVGCYPHAPGFKARGASEDAARRIGAGVARLRAKVLAELRDGGPGTADEVAKRLKRSPLSIRPRVSELRALGKVTAAGERRRNESGMSAAVWEFVS